MNDRHGKHRYLVFALAGLVLVTMTRAAVGQALMVETYTSACEKALAGGDHREAARQCRDALRYVSKATNLAEAGGEPLVLRAMRGYALAMAGGRLWTDEVARLRAGSTEQGTHLSLLQALVCCSAAGKDEFGSARQELQTRAPFLASLTRQAWQAEEATLGRCAVGGIEPFAYVLAAGLLAAFIVLLRQASGRPKASPDGARR